MRQCTVKRVFVHCECTVKRVFVHSQCTVKRVFVHCSVRLSEALIERHVNESKNMKIHMITFYKTVKLRGWVGVFISLDQLSQIFLFRCDSISLQLVLSVSQ